MGAENLQNLKKNHINQGKVDMNLIYIKFNHQHYNLLHNYSGTHVCLCVV